MPVIETLLIDVNLFSQTITVIAGPHTLTTKVGPSSVPALDALIKDLTIMKRVVEN